MSKSCAQQVVELPPAWAGTATTATRIITADNRSEERRYRKNVKRKAARVKKYERKREICSRPVSEADSRQQQQQGKSGKVRRNSAVSEVEMAEEVEVGSQAAETTKPEKEAGASPLSSSKVAEAVAAPAAGAMVTEVLQLDKNAAIELDGALPNREEAEASSANGSEKLLLGEGAARAGGTKAPEISKPARSSTRRTAVKLAEERRLKKATKQREARQRKKDRRAEGSRQDAAARQDAETAIRHQHDLDMAIKAAAAWQERLAEIQRNVAVGRAQQQAREGERERAAVAIQAALIKAVARRRCLRPYAARAMQADKAAAESRAQRRERERVGAAAAVIQAAWGRPAVRTRCRRAYALRTGERDHRRKRGARVIGAAWCAYGVARRTAEQPSPETQKSSAAEKKSTASEDATAAEVVSTTSLAKREEGGKEGSMTAVVAEKPKEVDELLLAKAEHALKEDRAREAAATERESADPAETNVARPAETRPSLEPPKPRRLHTTAAPSTPPPPAGPSTSEEPSSERDPPRLDHHVPHPLQLVEGKTLMYDPREFDLWPLMVQLQGWSLELGTADVWGGGVEREAEAFSAACGFSAAFGPIVLKLVTAAVYGRVFAGGVSVLPMDHVVYAFGQYWEKEIGPRDATERFFKLVKIGSGTRASGSGRIGKEELRRFVLAIALRHPDLDALPPDNKSIYVDTVLTILFYKFSRCGLMSLGDLRTSDFVRQMNAVGRLEMGLEDSQFFSLSRQELIRSEYLSLCGESRWGVGQEALRRYRREADVRAVGAVRAARVIHAGHRPPRCSSSCSSASSSSSPSSSCSSSSSSCSSSSSSSLFSTGGGCRRETLGYDAWVCFWLCEEALQSGACSRRDVRYCFALLDEGNLGRVGVREVEPFVEDAVSSGGSEDILLAAETVFARFQDSVGVKRTSQYISLQDVTKPANVKRAGRFFGYLFLGIDLDSDHDDDDRGPEGGVGIAAAAGTATSAGSGVHVRERECPRASLPSQPLASLPGDSCPASKPAPSPPPALPPPPQQQQQQQQPSRLPSLESSIRTIKAKLRVTAFSKSLSPTRPLLPTPPLTPPAPTPPRASPSPLSALSPPWVMPTSASPPPKQQQQQQQQQQRQQKQQKQRKQQQQQQQQRQQKQQLKQQLKQQEQQRRKQKGYRWHEHSYEHYNPEDDPDFEAELAAICVDGDRGDSWRIE